MAESSHKSNSHDDNQTGKVYLVGAGPGDPRLITLRGIECLAQAEVVLYDYLANPLILAHANPQAELLCLGRHGRLRQQDRVLTQAEINQQLIDHAAAGRRVVRLKGGDPAMFGRIAEEVAALQSADIDYEIVPGITAALACGSYAGIPITHRDHASAVALITGHERADSDHSKLDYEALARFSGTLVFYMGVTTAPTWTAELIAAGRDAATPAALVRRVSWPDQQVVRCTLGTVVEQLQSNALRPPVLVVVGEAVEAAGEQNWFSQRPLFGQTVLVTRPAQQTQEPARQFEDLGARCLRQPAIEISPPDDWYAVDESLAMISTYDWLVFSSANGVRFLLDRLLAAHGDLRLLAGTRLAVIGEKTAEALAAYHLTADLTPPEFRAEALAESLAADAAGQRFLLARASRGREVLSETLSAAGGAVEQIVVYNSSDIPSPDAEIAEELAAGRIDWISVTSSAIANSLVNLFGESLCQARLASISPITTATLAEAGFEVAAEASEYTTAGLVRAILAQAE